jgi:hypothetical protein
MAEAGMRSDAVALGFMSRVSATSALPSPRTARGMRRLMVVLDLGLLLRRFAGVPGTPPLSRFSDCGVALRP